MNQQGADAVRSEEERRLEEICGALEPAIYDGLLRFSARRCRWLARMGLPVDGGSVEEFVVDAIGDTIAGKRNWQPENCDLLTHLFGVIRSRTSDFFRRHGPILVRKQGEDEAAAEDNRAKAGVRRRIDDHVADVDLVTKLVNEIELLAEGDEEVQFLLAAYEDGVVVRREVMAQLDWDASQFDNARRRLDRLLKRLPEDIAQETRGVLGGVR